MAIEHLRTFGRNAFRALMGSMPEGRSGDVRSREQIYRALSNWDYLKCLVPENVFLGGIPSLQTNFPVEICSNYSLLADLNGREEFATVAVDPQGEAVLFVSSYHDSTGELDWVRVGNPEGTIRCWCQEGINADFIAKFAKMTRADILRRLMMGND